MDTRSHPPGSRLSSARASLAWSRALKPVRPEPMSGPCRRVGVIALAVIAAALADPAISDTWKVNFSVAVPESALVVGWDCRPPDKACIAHVNLALDEPVWMSGEIGLPELPYVVRTVAVPLKADVQGPTVNLGKGIETTGVDLVGWGQISWPGGGPPSAYGGDEESGAYYPMPDEVEFDSSALKMEAWPQNPVELVATRTAGKYQLLTYRVSPVQWFPASGLIRFTPQIDVDLVVNGTQPALPSTYAEAMEIEDLRALVVNAANVWGVSTMIFDPEPDTRYLIITDDYKWSSSIARLARAGDLVKEFARLAQWKTQKGVKGTVVTITDIVGGRWGDFRTGASDLQEVIRNFLKFAHREWSTYWVLLGGNSDIVPTRDVAAAGTGRTEFFFRTANETPNENDKFTYHYDGSGTVRLHHNGAVRSNTLICALNSGKAYSRLTSGAPSSSSPGWIYTDSTYTDESFVGESNFIILRAPTDEISATDFYPVLYFTTIPTDLYYASLVGPDYDQPGKHDWDKNDNGLWGQYNGGAMGDVDGVSMTPTIAVGRAPVATTDEADHFVDKVLSYERYFGGSGDPDVGRRLLLTADDWYSLPGLEPSSTWPPPESRYFNNWGNTWAAIHLRGVPGRNLSQFRLYAWYSDTQWQEVPYNLDADSTHLGYYFCTNDRYSTPALSTVSGSGHTWQVARVTSYVIVYGPSDQVAPAKYFFDITSPEQSVTEKEQVRSLLASLAPELDTRKRLYRDYVDSPDYPAADLAGLSQAAVRDALNFGYNVVSLTGHGNMWGCCGVASSWVLGLTNYYRAGLVYADSCLTNEFNKPKSNGSMDDTVSELFLKNSYPGGACAYVGNTRYSWIGGGAVFERAFWQRLPGQRHLGQLHNSKSPFTGDLCQRWTNYSLNLLGDPETELWLGRASVLDVNHPLLVTADGTVRVFVSVGGEPMGRAVVCLTAPTGMFILTETDVGGMVNLTVHDVTAPATLTLVVTVPGYAPYQGTIEVVGPHRIRRRL